MPTHDELPRFWKDWESLTGKQQDAFLDMVNKFVHDLTTGQFRKGLRVTRVQGTRDIWEVIWAMGTKDGRATFQYGPEENPGDPHVIWRRVGGHEIFGGP